MGTLTSEFKKEETNKSTGNDQHLGGYDHQDLGRHSILPHHRQSFFLGLALLEAEGHTIFESVETEVLS